MKIRIINIMLVVAMCAGLAGCSQAQPGATAVQPTAQKKVLIVYLSRTHNTEAVAGMIHKHTGGTLLPLELQTPYPENYQQIVAQVAAENEQGMLPPSKPM